MRPLIAKCFRWRQRAGFAKSLPLVSFCIGSVLIHTTSCSRSKKHGYWWTFGETDKPLGVHREPKSAGRVAGCDHTVQEGPYRASVVVRGQHRTFYVQPPRQQRAAQPMPLVIGYHGHSGNGQEFSGSYGRNWNDFALGIYPDGVAQAYYGNSVGWDVRTNASADVDFTAQLLAFARSRYCIDQTKIFAFGFSWGGWMANLAGCALPNDFSGVASISGGGPGYPATGGLSGCLKPVSAMIVHGRDDRAEPLDEANKSRRTWTLVNSCEEVSVPYDPSPCVRHNCASGAEFVFCEWDGGHDFPEWAQRSVRDFFLRQ